MPADSRPNIVLIMADQQRADAMGCAGNDIIRTPNIDRLAAEGVRFGRAFSQGPLCMPARWSLLTGRYVRDHGVFENDWDMTQDIPNLAQRLQEAGYYTSCIGKMHLFADETLVCGRPELASDPHVTPRYRQVGFDEPHPGPEKNGVMGLDCEYVDHLKERGLFEMYGEWFHLRAYPKKTATHLGLPMWFPESTPLPNEDYLDTWTGQEVVNWIDEYDRDEPFFQWVGFPGPHEPHDAPKDYVDLYRNVDIPLGERIPPEVPESGPLHTLMRWLQTTAQWEGLTDDIVQLLTRYYYANITAIDDQVGAIVEALERKGILDNTWIIYTADHGEMMGDHWMLWKMLFYEQSATVPLVIRPPAGMESKTVDGIVEHVDVTATIEALTGITPLPNSEGNSLIGHLDGSGSGPTREVAHSENYGFGMFATDRYKLVVFEDTKEPVQLFDLQEDPDENVNAVADPAYAGVIEQMMRDHVDPFFETPPKRPARGIWEVQAGRYEGNRHLSVRYPR